VIVALAGAPVFFAGAFAIGPRDAMTYLEVGSLLFAVAAVATYIPVRRASTTSPSEALSA
jgi:ABC-type antimicrobial peptide transport system permease subunit